MEEKELTKRLRKKGGCGIAVNGPVRCGMILDATKVFPGIPNEVLLCKQCEAIVKKTKKRHME